MTKAPKNDEKSLETDSLLKKKYKIVNKWWASIQSI